MNSDEINAKKSVYVKTRVKLCIVFCLLVVVVITVVCGIIYYKLKSSCDNVIAQTVKSTTSQVRINMEHFMGDIEKSCVRVFSDDTIIEYDPENSQLNAYDKVVTEDYIADAINQLSVTDSYADFGFVYSDNTTVGNITTSTAELYGKDIYSLLSSAITRVQTKDGWTIGYDNDYSHVYYVKRINDNCVLTASIYSSEIDRLVGVDDNSELSIFVINENDNIVFSSVDSDNFRRGDVLEGEILSLVNNGTDVLVENPALTASAEMAGDSWRIICAMPKTEFEISNNSLLTTYGVLIGISVIFIVLITFEITGTLVSSKNIIVSREASSVDVLTQLGDRISTEDKIMDKLEVCIMGSTFGFILVDIDNLKIINDNLGRRIGDETIMMIAELLKTCFGEDAIIGRIGGDKFAVLVDVSNFDLFISHDNLKNKCAEVCESLNEIYVDKERKARISVSVGASVYPLQGDTYDELYERADTALRKSKQKGRNCFTLYKETRTRVSNGGNNESNI